jgi:hypothetical protein
LAASVIQAGGGRVVMELRWRTDDNGGRVRSLFQVLTLRDGKIVDMQDCRTRRAALSYAGLT